MITLAKFQIVRVMHFGIVPMDSGLSAIMIMNCLHSDCVKTLGHKNRFYEKFNILKSIYIRPIISLFLLYAVCMK